MKHFFLILLFSLLGKIAWSQETVPLRSFEPLRFSENVQIPRYRIRETFLISDSTFLLVGRRDSVPESDAGWRLLLLKKTHARFHISQVTQPAGESYIYEPVFFEWGEKWVVFCELGTENSWGADGFIWDGEQLIELGHLPVAAGIKPAFDYAESILPFLRPFASGNRLQLTFSDKGILDGTFLQGVKLILNPGKAEARTHISPTDLRYSWKMGGELTEED